MRTVTSKIGRNSPCPCGSGKKYKHCCAARDSASAANARGEEAWIQGTLQGAAELHQAGRFSEAENMYQHALQVLPGDGRIHFNLGNVLVDQGRLQDAAASYRESLKHRPGAVESHCNLGSVLRKLGKPEEAVAEFRKALAIEPRSAFVHFNLGNALKDHARLDEACDSYLKALAIDPGFEDAQINLWRVLEEQGRTSEALASYRSVLARRPGDLQAYTSQLFLSAYQQLTSPQEYLALARGWEAAALGSGQRQEARARTFRRASPEGRRLRVGYVSGDLYNHPVSHFVEALLSSHDRSRVEVFVYSTGPVRDAATDRIASTVERWIPAAGLPDAAFLQRIHADAIDVLIDLSGHTNHSRLAVFARRAAPVQAHYLGYFASTGLTEMDYWICDEVLAPPGAEAHFSEKLWRLPRTWLGYAGRARAPASAWRPDPAGRLCLGSFNDLKKLTPQTLALWASVLQAIPDSSLLLKTKSLGDAGNRRRIESAFLAHGVAAGRIELQGSAATPSWESHMAYYDRLDIALDPVDAVGGGTTTCDALWMGVPLVTLAGDRVASRMSASMLGALGHPEWIAASPSEYVTLTVALAKNVELRASLRAAQRARMAASTLCDSKGLAKQIEEAAAEMFRRWFDGAAGRPAAAQGSGR
jgi:predicted O-linked N-acetylglucosamine transferase (SPINDLY family)